MHDEYITYVNQKYDGTIVVDPFKKTYGTDQPYLNGKVYSTFTYQHVPVVFTMNISTPSSPYSAAFKISGDFPSKCTLIPRSKLWQLIYAKKPTFKRKYKTSIDRNLEMNMVSNEPLTEFLNNSPTHIVIQKKETHRLLVIHPRFSILSLDDFQILESIALELLSCFSIPRFH